MRINVWAIITCLLAVTLVAVLLFKPSGMATLPSNEVGMLTVNFITNEILAGQSSAELVNVSEEHGLYLVTFRVDDRLYSTYVSKDGKYLFPQTIELMPKPQTGPAYPQSDKPVVKFFVMSFCPFGQQAEAGLAPVVNLLGDKVIFEPHYVIYENYCGYGRTDCDETELAQFCIADGELCSMHGIDELWEDARQLCINKLYPEKFWEYVTYVNSHCSLSNINTCWKEAAESVGLDIAEIENCVSTESEDLLRAEYNLNIEFNVRGSPTIFINDKLYQGQRSPEAFKNAICSAFTTQPNECEQKLSEQAASAGNC